jgi:phosphoesterase RecJ-like protein
MVKAEEFKEAMAAIAAAKRVIVTTHTRPDGDGAGCIAAVCELLREMGKEAYPLFLSPLPGWYGFLLDEKVPVLKGAGQLDGEPYSSCDLVLVVDTNSAKQLPVISDWFKKTRKPLLVIDHHIRDGHLGGVEVVDEKAAAAGVVVYEFIKHSGRPVSKKMATALFAAISSDTGWFRFSSVDGRTLRVAAELVEAGAEPAALYKTMFQNYPAARMRLLQRLLANLELYAEGKLAVVCLRSKDFKETAAARSDTDNMIDECQRIESVEAVIMLVEQEDGNYRCSLRSKGLVDVQKVAVGFGGGGHRQAAGVTMEMGLEEAAEKLKKAIEGQLLK